ncbi:MAG: N-formylglutamate deformylase [Gammaproteobacteria bacterium]|nr:N-formylglutamate deformylase [Gammaproteobacteria bacterium]MDH5309274.1 N-formylglutamate deformylase [Gammaproteobacteria bacterium]
MSEERGFEFHPGDAPLLVSVPHDGRAIPEAIAGRMTEHALELPDTDWHVARLYAFCRGLGASLLVARCSRYVIDLNRPPDDGALYRGQMTTGLCPTMSFAGLALYRDGEEPDSSEIRERVSKYWEPYHARIADCLNAMVEQHGHALLWDAHSIASEVPLLFEGRLPVLNIGTNGGASCAAPLRDAVSAVANESPFSLVTDGRFRGGYITRHYGDPARGRHAIQLELAQRAYMDERLRLYDEDRAARLAGTLAGMLAAFANSAAALYGSR